MENVQTTTDAAVETPALPRPSKAATVAKLLSRNRGATLAEIMDATSWQPHSARAFLSGIRKKKELLKETRRSGETCYRFAN
ncbi:DUF3489 domain-containing protein [Rhizorhabdus dicambivorans]|uniref:DUF3489 domain-containing protein n=1 Tax=Rhizorhabdus dicambivorans TaxID=1850238 RepID=A0A2A4FUZ2_9SPHN|nr:DUF3489 domain-containing protein [Rhizorhabdus dicambivorans]ATE64128.1 DUF3489 domain-containing protein [Rhizorhabdus dicambivorans]PCE42601.1 DUF3489 domain-containing protein [Rhizorhabdus dicambivorans]